MSEPSQVDQNLTPRAGCWLFLLPVILGVVMIAGYLLVFVYGVIGQPADGPRVKVVFSGCPAGAEIVKHRVEAMGLGDPAFEPSAGGFALTATLPSDAAIADTIPATLAKTGAFSAVDLEDGAIVVDGPIASSTLHYGVDAPETIVQLDAVETATLRDWMEAHPHSHMSYRVDGVEAFKRANIPAEAKGTVELPVYGVTVEKALQIAAERDIVLASGTMPCAVTVASVTKISE